MRPYADEIRYCREAFRVALLAGDWQRALAASRATDQYRMAQFDAEMRLRNVHLMTATH